MRSQPHDVIEKRCICSEAKDTIVSFFSSFSCPSFCVLYHASLSYCVDVTVTAITYMRSNKIVIFLPIYRHSQETMDMSCVNRRTGWILIRHSGDVTLGNIGNGAAARSYMNVEMGFECLQGSTVCRALEPGCIGIIDLI